jgi:glutamine cyclotransferase
MQDGWGLTTDGEHIIGSDGTANLYFMDPSTFKEVRIITVQDEGQPVTGLNELEYISNEIWSNVFMVSDPSQLQNVW